MIGRAVLGNATRANCPLLSNLPRISLLASTEALLSCCSISLFLTRLARAPAVILPSTKGAWSTRPRSCAKSVESRTSEIAVIMAREYREGAQPRKILRMTSPGPEQRKIPLPCFEGGEGDHGEAVGRVRVVQATPLAIP